jgi:hypothetical protein
MGSWMDPTARLDAMAKRKIFAPGGEKVYIHIYTINECNFFAVYPSKYRGVVSSLCCFVTVACGLIIATGVPSKMAMLYVVMVIPAVMGIVPVEEKVKAVLSYTRLWGLRWDVINYYTHCSSHYQTFHQMQQIKTSFDFKIHLFVI